MSEFASMRLPLEHTVVAPDGSDVRVLLGLASGEAEAVPVAGPWPPSAP